MLLIAGERDTDVAQAAQKTVERNRLGKVAYLETRLQGDVLIRLEPKVAETLLKFLEEPVKFRGNATWVPRYLMTPDALERRVDSGCRGQGQDQARAGGKSGRQKAGPRRRRGQGGSG